MTGGYVRKHRHPGSLRVFSRTLPSSSHETALVLDGAFAALSTSRVSECATTCPMYEKGKCIATGRVASIGKDCEAQMISRNER